MKNQYPIVFGNNVVGTATEEQAGLYRSYECRCKFCDEKLHRIIIRTGEKQIDLGICVPEGDSFVVRKRIPIKSISSGEPQFLVDPDNSKQSIWQKGETCIDIPLLKEAKLWVENGHISLVIFGKGQNSSSSPTGQ